MSFLGGLFQSKPITPTEDTRNPQRLAVDQFLSDYVSKFGKSYQPGATYGGQFTAPLGRFERRGLDEFLTGYLNQPDVTSQLGDVRGMLNKTITGGFDPGTSDYYQALRNEAMYNRGQAVRDTNADLGARGKYFSTEALNKYGDINAQTQIGLDKVMAGLANQERNRSMEAVPYATHLEDYLAKMPLQKATAATTLGAIPRMIDQADLEALYQDFLRRQGEKKDVLSAASGVSSSPMSYQAYQKSPFEQFVMPLMQTAISGLMRTASPMGAAGMAGGTPDISQLFAQMHAA